MNRGAAFVVGGSGGLGSAICRALAPEWDQVAIGYARNRARAEALGAELPGSALPVRCDLGDAASIGAAITEVAEACGGIGTMVFASGVEIGQPFVSKITEDQWREVIETEVIGFTRVVAATLPLFRAQGHGNFVAVVSFATYHYPQGDALSAVPKAAIEMLGRAIAKEEGRYRIRANMVAPGIIDAGLGADFLKRLYTPEIWETQRKRIPLKRFGDGADIADAVAFLASERATYITGQTIIVDGGLSL
jgi:NAD(P)-dependent dehydrogenase (short-subunit alcohol dehydrogenase family)